MEEILDKKRIVNDVKRDLSKIIEEGNGKLLDDNAEKLGKLLGKKRKYGGTEAKTSQIRNVFDKIKRMDYDTYNVPLIRAKLFYVAGRHKEMEPLKDILSSALDLVDNKQKFDRFKDFFEAIVAYHKYYGEWGG